MSQNASKHILLLIASDDYRKVVELALRMRSDWKVVSANSVVRGLAIAKEIKFDAVLLDSVFVEADLERVLTHYPEVTVPAIAFVEGRAADWDSLIEQGAAGVIPKMENLLNLPEQVAKILQW